eukprot:4943-Rhodomonas_salina.1
MHPSLSLDIVPFISEHINLLSAVHVRAKQSLYEGPGLEAAICKYTTDWMPRLDRMLRGEQGVSLPSLDICWVWHLHKLDPTAYHRDCVAAFGRVLGVPPGLSPFQFELNTEVGAQPDDIPQPNSSEGVEVSADLVGCARRQSSFLWQVSAREYDDEAFLHRAVERYVKFLQLSAKFPSLFVVPTYDIDVVWHTHMAFPEQYKTDTVALTGKLFNHDDSDGEDRSAESKLIQSTQATQRLWCQTYDDTWEISGGMHRGEPTGIRQILSAPVPESRQFAVLTWRVVGQLTTGNSTARPSARPPPSKSRSAPLSACALALPCNFQRSESDIGCA